MRSFVVSFCTANQATCSPTGWLDVGSSNGYKPPSVMFFQLIAALTSLIQKVALWENRRRHTVPVPSSLDTYEVTLKYLLCVHEGGTGWGGGIHRAA